MTKMIYPLTLIIVVGLISVVFLITDGKPSAESWPLQQPSASYEVDAWGTNPDLIEFTPKGNPDYFCILAVSGSDTLKTMFCMPKGVQGE